MVMMSVKQFQQDLIDLGYDLGPAGADGEAGPMTIAAATAFQRDHGLVADGVAGTLTQSTLANVATFGKPLRAAPVEPPWLTLARGELGTVEGIGKGNNPKVVAYFADAGFAGVKDDATAWCAAFVGAMLHRAGFKPSGSLAARSYESWGYGLKTPALGCIATKKRAGNPWQGHVTFVVAADETHIWGLGGNQGDRVDIAMFKRSEFTSWRMPIGVTLASGKLPTTLAGAKSGVSEA